MLRNIRNKLDSDSEEDVFMCNDIPDKYYALSQILYYPLKISNYIMISFIQFWITPFILFFQSLY